MSIRTRLLALCLPLIALGCAPIALQTADQTGSPAAIVGKVNSNLMTAQAITGTLACPELRVSLNGAPVSIDFDNDCAFVVDEVAPSDLVELRVEHVDLAVAGTVELIDVKPGELIEVVVESRGNALSITIERRTRPDPSDILPELIDDNNVSIRLPDGIFETDLTVDGNNFTLSGEAGVDCNSTAGWTVIDGTVLVLKNNATFRNIMFIGTVELRGNNPRFINCCFDDAVIISQANRIIDDEHPGRGRGNRGGNHDDDDEDQGNDNDD